MVHFSRTPGRPRGRPPTTRPGRYSNNLRPLRERAGLTQEQVAARIGWDINTYGAKERGERRINLDEIPILAPAVEAEPGEILSGAPVKLRGLLEVREYVGPGGEILPIEGELQEIELPRGLAEDAAVAIEVRDDSLYPLGSNGWILLYERTFGGVPFDAVGELCVVKLANGPVLLRQLRRGYARGRFNLLAPLRPPVEDVELEWAAPVKAILDPQLVSRQRARVA